MWPPSCSMRLRIRSTSPSRQLITTPKLTGNCRSGLPLGGIAPEEIVGGLCSGLLNSSKLVFSNSPSLQPCRRKVGWKTYGDSVALLNLKSQLSIRNPSGLLRSFVYLPRQLFNVTVRLVVLFLTSIHNGTLGFANAPTFFASVPVPPETTESSSCQREIVPAYLTSLSCTSVSCDPMPTATSTTLGSSFHVMLSRLVNAGAVVTLDTLVPMRTSTSSPSYFGKYYFTLRHVSMRL